VWRRLLYLVCTAEAAVLAAALYLLVIAPEYALSPRMRQLCAISALLLASGCCYAVVRQVRVAMNGVQMRHR
jgi:alkylhydroperoxidase/carboxymuconolactone decarboxylase family protein YurZ